MKRLLAILLIFFTLFTQAQTGFLGRATYNGWGSQPAGPIAATLDSVTVWDENPVPYAYGGFPYGAKGSDGALLCALKASNTHASTGPLYICRSTTGGATWDRKQIYVGGTDVNCSALIMTVLSTGRILIVYQDNPGEFTETYRDIKIVYSDNQGATWRQGDTWTPANDPDSLYATSILGRPLELPSGKVLIPYYQYPNPYDTASAALPSIAAFLTTTNGGQTLTDGAVVLQQTGGTYPNGYTSEIGWEITHNTGSDATCKIVGLLRNEQYGYFHHVRSSDGGTTWERIAGETGGFANDMFYEFGDVLQKSPVDIKLHEGTIYIINGVRKNDGSGQFLGELEYLTCTPDNLFNNVKAGYSAKVKLWDSIADDTMAEIDFGYPTLFVDAYGRLVTHFYDASPNYVGFPADKRCMIYQLVIDRPD